MKKNWGTWLIVAIGVAVMSVGTIAISGAKRIDDLQGSVTDTIRNAETTGATVGMNKVLIVNPIRNEMYDAVHATFKMGQWTQAGLDATGEGDSINHVDTLIINLYSERGARRILLLSDTAAGTAPCSLSIDRYAYLPKAGDTSTAGVWMGGAGGYNDPAFAMDHLWFTYQMIDSAGAGDTLANSIAYTFRFIEGW